MRNEISTTLREPDPPRSGLVQRRGAHPPRPERGAARLSERLRGRGRVERLVRPPGSRFGSVISTTGSPRPRSSIASGSALERIVQRRAFGMFPHRSHKTCGGVPSRPTRSTKSSSFVKTTTCALRALSKISGSSASRRPRSRTCIASTANCLRIHRQRIGEMWASNQRITGGPGHGRRGCSQTVSRHRRPRFRDQDAP